MSQQRQLPEEITFVANHTRKQQFGINLNFFVMLASVSIDFRSCVQLGLSEHDYYFFISLILFIINFDKNILTLYLCNYSFLQQIRDAICFQYNEVFTVLRKATAVLLVFRRFRLIHNYLQRIWLYVMSIPIVLQQLKLAFWKYVDCYCTMKYLKNRIILYYLIISVFSYKKSYLGHLFLRQQVIYLFIIQQ